MKKIRWNHIPIIKNRKTYYCVSLGVILLGVIVGVINVATGRGLMNFDVEFTGGTSIHLDIGREFDNDDIMAAIKEVTGQSAPQVQRVVGKYEVLMKMKSVDQPTRLALIDKLAVQYGRADEGGKALDDFVVSADDVSGTISNEMQRTAVTAIAVACFAMLVYVSIRFRNLLTGGSAILAQLHDAAIMLCAYIIFRIPVNYSFIAAILTVLGYSINATIVVFDRVRENQRADKRLGRQELIDVSVNQTMTRSLYTSLTTVVTLVALYILGVPSVKEFVLPIIVGVVSGTYASVFLAGSMWYSFSAMRERRK